MMVTIRKYELKDYENVRYACLNSKGPNRYSESKGKFVLLTYCNYYIEQEPENCFVADDGGRAVGYIICTSDYDKFKRVFYRNYALKTLRLGFGMFLFSMSSAIPQRKYKKTYPAHMHMDILPEYQRQGIGSRLVDTLCGHLKEKGAKGVMLTASAKNDIGNSFYKKYGFTLLEAKEEYVAYGIRLD